ncbi:hypothetical protein NDU88_007095 [Pleurodeles waltl]|uniref:Uncharacterized protein n=1 Tax=Pleurodeles waltl TaxID=8319 RepID=A0AAV7VRM6_PLEWA|nr:hypothetical protein NDU88_007095 [Pleurodeles waltl]
MAPQLLESVSRGAQQDKLYGPLLDASLLLSQSRAGGEAGGGRARRERDRGCSRSSPRPALHPTRTDKSQSRLTRGPGSARSALHRLLQITNGTPGNHCGARRPKETTEIRGARNAGAADAQGLLACTVKEATKAGEQGRSEHGGWRQCILQWWTAAAISVRVVAASRALAEPTQNGRGMRTHCRMRGERVAAWGCPLHLHLCQAGWAPLRADSRTDRGLPLLRRGRGTGRSAGGWAFGRGRTHGTVPELFRGVEHPVPGARHKT